MNWKWLAILVQAHKEGSKGSSYSNFQYINELGFVSVFLW